MKIYPGVKARMGRWTYYMVKMTMRDLASSVQFASEGYESPTLDKALQRTLNESRAKKEIVRYLQRQPDRFFNSIVIAAIGGKPKWSAISMESDPRLELLADDPALRDSFGVLRFSGQEKYYALDGQHRLAAIRELVRPDSDAFRDAPSGFAQEEISVVLVTPGEAEGEDVFRQRFRRLFGHLNRYAKPMDQATNIIMDEDDAVAIVTRWLFSDHEFFKTVGPHRESTVVDVEPGKNMTHRDTKLFKLEVLYSFNEKLLSSRKRENEGWDGDGVGSDLKEFKRFRPTDERVLERLYEELSSYWDSILRVFGIFRTAEPINMRNHAVVDNDERGDARDHLLFWPIGQLLLAEAIRTLWDNAECKPEDAAQLDTALQPLANAPWDLDDVPWRHFLLVPPEREGGAWRMRSEDRSGAVRLATSLVLGMCIPGGANSEAMGAFKESWRGYLVPAFPAEQVDAMWERILASYRRR